MPPATFDLQSHSTVSDGGLDPARVVDAAARAGVELLALTDHDSTDGVRAAQAAGMSAGVRVVPAVELSVLDETATDLHVCGYLIDPQDPALRGQLERSRSDRRERAVRTVARLRELGFAVDERVLTERAAAGLAIGRPHLADAVVAHPANAARLAAEGVEEATRFLVSYLVEGRPAFLPREAPSVQEAITLIHNAGGVAVWAHPFWDVDSGDAVLATLERFLDLGLDGVEAFYVTHTERQTRLLHDWCTAHGVLTTGSSDFHGPRHRRFNRFRAFETYGLVPHLGPIGGVPPVAPRPRRRHEAAIRAGHPDNEDVPR